MTKFDENTVLIEKLRLQSQIDAYKDDLIITQDKLLKAKDDLIRELRGERAQ